MTELRALMIAASEYDTEGMLHDWRWLIPPTETPLFLSVFGDWVFGRPDGSLWCLSLLEGRYHEIARDAAEYNVRKQSPEWLDGIFLASWQEIATRNGMNPGTQDCLGWKIHPLIGGSFAASNLQVYLMSVYQTVMGQMHRQFQGC